MRRLLPALALIVSAGVVLCSEPSLSARSAAQQISQPLRGFGASITAAYEGWFNNADGTHNFLIGYYNRNEKQAADIPIGVNNRMEPGGPDMGQPTHFLPGRQVGMFTALHNIAVDRAGNIYTAEVNTGQRVQKFRRLDAQD